MAIGRRQIRRLTLHTCEHSDECREQARLPRYQRPILRLLAKSTLGLAFLLLLHWLNSSNSPDESSEQGGIRSGGQARHDKSNIRPTATDSRLDADISDRRCSPSLERLTNHP